VRNPASIINLKTNFLFNLVKLLGAFILFVILGIVAKVFPYYHLETVILALIIGVTLWFYRLKYKGKLKSHGTVIEAVMRINVFNHKVIKISVNSGNENIVFRYTGKSDSIDFEDNNLAFRMRLLAEFKKNRKCVVELFDN
jgi:predicted membrane metal-binding protein